MKRYRIIGLQRSGTHAIVGWLRSLMLEEGCKFLNNVLNPVEQGIYRGEGKQTVEDMLAAPMGHYLYTVEDAFFGPCMELPLEAIAEEFDLRGETETLLVLREPRNLFASRWRYEQNGSATYLPNNGPAQACWKQHARLGCDFRQEPGRLLPVLFDEWFANPAYRKQIADRLCLSIEREDLSAVSELGSGSSFDGTRYDGRAQQMDVLRRHERVSRGVMARLVPMEMQWLWQEVRRCYDS